MTLTNTNGSEPRVHFALCAGRGLPLCDSCSRNEEQHPIAAINPQQSRLKNPLATDDGRCADWRA
jgi:hypothetical protein